MLAVRAVYRDGKLKWLESPPADAQGMVAVLFLETSEATGEDQQEAALLTASPTFQRLVERSLTYVAAEETRPLQALLDELPD